ncbi:hypothetical protein BU26DRAFT_42897 [Trematosphaeria pertusa]|uniref:Uncharacterized protein n=1 Tax=Trematosphaeria pertusa TaxID=390896 RepID=A0A6A6J427_9PLEO|nr:uncharacterized protein BU26DRAFT_42897 [Trematosphaeria pertusa]KAF2257396.1 hypothetical protein BU26DRAFT_42897 [Trematosphaeria pertusa]
MPREIRLLPLHQQILDFASDPGSAGQGLQDAEENPAPASIGEILGASLHYWKFPAGVKEASFGARKPQNSLTPYLRPPVERWVRDYYCGRRQDLKLHLEIPLIFELWRVVHCLIGLRQLSCPLGWTPFKPARSWSGSCRSGSQDVHGEFLARSSLWEDEFLGVERLWARSHSCSAAMERASPKYTF